MMTFAPAAPAYRRVTGTPTWRAISRRHRVRLVETLEWISDRLRQKGEHGGPATHATIRVFRALLFRFANTATGVCLPGYKALAEAARTCERTAERAVSGWRRSACSGSTPAMPSGLRRTAPRSGCGPATATPSPVPLALMSCWATCRASQRNCVGYGNG